MIVVYSTRFVDDIVGVLAVVVELVVVIAAAAVVVVVVVATQFLMTQYVTSLT